MVMDTAAGIQHLHTERVIHRDLAIRNLLLDEQFRVKVCVCISISIIIVVIIIIIIVCVVVIIIIIIIMIIIMIIIIIIIIIIITIDQTQIFGPQSSQGPIMIAPLQKNLI